MNSFIIDSKSLSKLSNKSIRTEKNANNEIIWKSVSDQQLTGAEFEFTYDTEHVTRSVDVLAWSHGLKVDRPAHPVPTHLRNFGGPADILPKNTFTGWLRNVSSAVQPLHELSSTYVDENWEKYRRFARNFYEIPGYQRPVYDFSRSSTGRPSIVGGHNFISTPWIERSKWKAGEGEDELYIADMNAFEARVLAARIQLSLKREDAYTQLAEKILRTSDRERAKRAILASLFGAGENFVKSTAGEVSLSEIALVRNAFRLTQFECEADGRLKLPSGRKLASCAQRLHPSHYAQGTAVDVAWNRFMRASELAGDAIRPVAIIHDALLFASNAKMIDDAVKAFADTDVDNITGGTFPVKIKSLKTSCKEHES